MKIILSRLSAIFVILMLAAIAAIPAGAAEIREFDRAAFNAALADGKPVLVEVKAWWCPVCASQGRTVRNAVKMEKFNRLVIFELSYDRQEAEWKSFGAKKQGTLIAFRDGREVGRLEFVTDKPEINALLDKTVGGP